MLNSDRLLIKGLISHRYKFSEAKKIFPDIKYRLSWQSAVKGCDAVVIMTEWNEFRGMDLIKLKKLMHSPVILDTRNILNIAELKELGFKFDNVGRK